MISQREQRGQEQLYREPVLRWWCFFLEEPVQIYQASKDSLSANDPIKILRKHLSANFEAARLRTWKHSKSGAFFSFFSFFSLSFSLDLALICLHYWATIDINGWMLLKESACFVSSHAFLLIGFASSPGDLSSLQEKGHSWSGANMCQYLISLIYDSWGTTEKQKHVQAALSFSLSLLMQYQHGLFYIAPTKTPNSKMKFIWLCSFLDDMLANRKLWETLVTPGTPTAAVATTIPKQQL